MDTCPPAFLWELVGEEPPSPFARGECCQPPPSLSSQVLCLQGVICSSVISFILLFAYSLSLICLCFMSLPPFPQFFQFHSLKMLPCCHFYFHAWETAFLDPYVLSFLL